MPDPVKPSKPLLAPLDAPAVGLLAIVIAFAAGANAGNMAYLWLSPMLLLLAGVLILRPRVVLYYGDPPVDPPTALID